MSELLPAPKNVRDLDARIGLPADPERGECHTFCAYGEHNVRCRQVGPQGVTLGFVMWLREVAALGPEARGLGVSAAKMLDWEGAVSLLGLVDGGGSDE